MNAGEALTVAGVAFQVVGAIVALQGLIKTHDAYAEKSIRLLVAQEFRGFGEQVRRALNRLLRRRQDAVARPGPASGSWGTFPARSVITWGPLDPALSEREAIEALDSRVRELVNRLNNFEGTTLESAAEMRESLKELRKDVAEGDKGVTVLIRRAAIEGLMREAVGLFLVIVGSALQGWGAVA